MHDKNHLSNYLKKSTEKKQQIFMKKQSHSQSSSHWLILKDNNVSSPLPYAYNEYMFSRVVEKPQKL